MQARLTRLAQSCELETQFWHVNSQTRQFLLKLAASLRTLAKEGK